MPNKKEQWLYGFWGIGCLFPLNGCVNTMVPSNVQIDEFASAEWVNTCEDWDDWDKQGPAFRLFGNSYYVGTCGISAILITGDQGHVLIDGSTEAGADVIIKNIQSLGIPLKDIKWLLHTHEHFDHVAGLAKLQQLSGAKLLASPQAAPVLRTGITAEADPQAGTHDPFPPARVDGLITDNQALTLGNLELTPVATPGHTPGALSWQWQSCENGQCLTLVYSDTLSPVSRDDYHFSDHPQYLDRYRQSINTLATLDCQLLVTPHPSASKMRDRLMSEEGLINIEACSGYARKVSKWLDKRLAKENAS